MIELEGRQQTCPSHRRDCVISARVSIPVLFLNSSFEMVVHLQNVSKAFGLEHLVFVGL